MPIANPLVDRKYRLPRIWSNQELAKFAGLFSGEVVNVSAYRDEDKQGRHYRDYFTSAASYALTNYEAQARGLQGFDGEIYLDLEQELPAELVQRFDVVFNHTVLEHVYRAHQAFENLCRMTRDVVILVVPFLQQMHADYGDFWRFSPSAVKRLFTDHGLDLLYLSFNEHRKASTYIFAIASKQPELWQGKIPRQYTHRSQSQPADGFESFIGCHALGNTGYALRWRIRESLRRLRKAILPGRRNQPADASPATRCTILVSAGPATRPTGPASAIQAGRRPLERGPAIPRHLVPATIIHQDSLATGKTDMQAELDYIHFPNRDVRAKYIATRFSSVLAGRVLDVGCDRARLRDLVPSLDYVGIDIGGEPDLVVNLDEVERLPFPDNHFDCVICSDVLEHLDGIHRVFGELLRVTRAHLIVSLPNNWCCVRRHLARGFGTLAHYGLPAEPAPDRHKWFFNLSEAAAFVDAQVEKHGAEIVQTIVNEKPRFAPVRLLRRLRHPRFWNYQNRYGNTLWWLIHKTCEGTETAANGGAAPAFSRLRRTGAAATIKASGND